MTKMLIIILTRKIQTRLDDLDEVFQLCNKIIFLNRCVACFFFLHANRSMYNDLAINEPGIVIARC